MNEKSSSHPIRYSLSLVRELRFEFLCLFDNKNKFCVHPIEFDGTGKLTQKSHSNEIKKGKFILMRELLTFVT